MQSREPHTPFDAVNPGGAPLSHISVPGKSGGRGGGEGGGGGGGEGEGGGSEGGGEGAGSHALPVASRWKPASHSQSQPRT